MGFASEATFRRPCLFRQKDCLGFPFPGRIYLLDDPWWSTMDGELRGRFSHGMLYGYRYLNFPWLTSYDGRVHHYLYGPFWGFDAASSLYWKFE